MGEGEKRLSGSSEEKRALLLIFRHGLRWSLFLGYALFLYILFTLPPEELPSAVLEAHDKLLHFLDFFLLALLAFRAFYYSPQPFFYLQAGEKALLFSLLYGAFLEWAQRGVSGRVPSLADWGADALGTLAASGIFRISRLTQR